MLDDDCSIILINTEVVFSSMFGQVRGPKPSHSTTDSLTLYVQVSRCSSDGGRREVRSERSGHSIPPYSFSLLGTKGLRGRSRYEMLTFVPFTFIVN